MLFRIASLLTAVIYILTLFVSVRIAHVFKYYGHYASTLVFPDDTIQHFDFIIVGAGSAGSVIANRLSKNNKVLLLEAGGTPFYANQIPMLGTLLLHTPKVDYMYKTVEHKKSLRGQIGLRARWPRGKLLGGTSNLFSMVYFRCHPYDFDNWANITEDNSWSYANIKKYFDMSINYHGRFLKSSPYSGNQHVDSFQLTPLYDTFMEAGREMGYETNADFNTNQRPGFGPPDAYIRDGSRETSYSAFLEPILDRKNLVISKYSQVVKIKFVQKSAVGVFFRQHGKLKYASASKEIILSAGSIDSPKLLMLSGVGPGKRLKDIGIKPLVDLPVGENLQDHLITLLFPFSFSGPPYYSYEKDLGIMDLINYFGRGTGFFTLPIGSFSQAVFPSSFNKNGLNPWNDLLMYISHLPPTPLVVSEMSKSTNIRQDILETLFSKSGYGDDDGFYIALALTRPKSSGLIKLQDKDPSTEPIIDPNYLSHPDDIVRIVEGIKIALNIVECTDTFKGLNATYVNIPIDDCRSHTFRSDAYWECYVMHMGISMYHPVGTCRMGSGTKDKRAVVDSRLRVLHTTGLRVADASVMPDITNGNTNAPTVMIGEKAADMIREYWSEQYRVCKMTEILRHDNKMCFYSKLI